MGWGGKGGKGRLWAGRESALCPNGFSGFQRASLSSQNHLRHHLLIHPSQGWLFPRSLLLLLSCGSRAQHRTLGAGGMWLPPAPSLPWGRASRAQAGNGLSCSIQNTSPQTPHQGGKAPTGPRAAGAPGMHFPPLPHELPPSQGCQHKSSFINARGGICAALMPTYPCCRAPRCPRGWGTNQPPQPPSPSACSSWPRWLSASARACGPCSGLLPGSGRERGDGHVRTHGWPQGSGMRCHLPLVTPTGVFSTRCKHTSTGAEASLCGGITASRRRDKDAVNCVKPLLKAAPGHN